MIYVQFLLVSLWLMVCCVFGLILLPFRWGDLKLDRDFARLYSWGTLKITGIRIELEGAEHLTAHQPCVYVANHQGNFDMSTFGAFYPDRTIVIGKKELLWIPLFGLFFVGAGNIAIKRQSREKAIAGLDAAVAEMRRKKASIWIFPEGHRNKTGVGLLPFKKGAFHMALGAQVPIVPIVSAPLKPLVDWERKRSRGGVLRMRVLPPIGPQGYGPRDMERLSNDVRERMLEALRGLEA